MLFRVAAGCQYIHLIYPYHMQYFFFYDYLSIIFFINITKESILTQKWKLYLWLAVLDWLAMVFKVLSSWIREMMRDGYLLDPKTRIYGELIKN